MFNQTTDTPDMPTSEPMPTGGSSALKKIATTLGVIVFLGSVGAAGYFYKQYTALKQNPNKVAQDEATTLIASVGKLMLLPSGEQPTIATVTDPSKLKDQVFFTNAKAGDKVLIYTNAKKAILYNPGSNKIVDVAPVNIGEASNAPAATSTVSGASTTATTPPATDTTKK